MMENGFSGSQVITELDAMRAVYDYMSLQLDGRFRLQFPEHREIIDEYVNDFLDDQVRQNADGMKFALAMVVNRYGTTLTNCSIKGCPHEDNHQFMREFINLVWDVRIQTAEWLKGQGIVPGQSAN